MKVDHPFRPWFLGKRGLLVLLSASLTSLAAAVPRTCTAASCPGDCDGGGDVTISELITGVNVALGSAGLERCPAFDANGDQGVTVDELIRAVNAALGGCSTAPTATPLPTSPLPNTATATRAGAPTSTPTVPSGTPSAMPTPAETNEPQANDETVATTVFDSTRFLYEGEHPAQKGVAPDTIDPVRVVVVRGRVLGGAGLPFRGATVSVLDHPEFGHTVTDDRGEYALAVNGGGLLTVDFARAGFVTVQRRVQPAWQEWSVIDDVVMTALDTVSTVIDLSGGSAGWQMHRASRQADVDGSRNATLLFPPNATGEMVFRDGSSAPLTRCTVRVTEVTVGPLGEAAMPAELPPTSNYTYAAAFDCDEALAAATTRVEFTPALPLYVDNFLGFPVGIEVPYGVYDSFLGAWVAEPNGVVLRVTGITAGRVDLDLDGEDGGDADPDPELYPAFAITDGEREALAASSAAGMEYWRVQVRRFSKGDLNWSAVLPAASGAARGAVKGRTRRLTDKGRKRRGHGTIEPEEQVFHEDVPLAGVPFGLHYTSRRQPGRSAEYEVDAQITDDAPPPPLEKVVTELRVAGRVIRDEWTKAPNQNVTIRWDGLDAFGRPAYGRQKGTLRVGYVYVPDFVRGAGFAVPRSQVLRQGRGGQWLTVWTPVTVALGQVGTEAAGLGGWTPTIWHTYDPVGGTLHLGDGTVRSVEGSVLVSEELLRSDDLTDNVDNILVDRDGSIVFLQQSPGTRIRRYRPDTGALEVVAGGGADEDHDDGGADARSTKIFAPAKPQGLALGADGSVYWAETGVERVRRVRDGRVETVAGKFNEHCRTGDRFAACGDGGPAVGPTLDTPTSVGVLADGSLLIGERASPGGNVSPGPRIRRVDPGGTIHRFAGTGGACPQFDAACRTTEPVLATEADMASPLIIARGADGTVYVAVLSATEWIYEISPQGMMRRVACRGASGGIDAAEAGGAAALDLRCDDVGSAIRGLAVDADGTLHVAMNSRGDTVHLLAIGRDGKVRNVAFEGSIGDAGGDGGPALLAQLGSASLSGTFGFAPDGTIVVADGTNRRLLRLRPALPGFNDEGILIPSEDAAEVYVFDANGRHLATRQALTGAAIWRFGYDTGGRLVTITDREGDVATITRAPTAPRR